MATKQQTQTVENIKLNEYFYAKGRRKTSVATVRLYDSSGQSTINGKPLQEIAPHDYQQANLNKPFKAVDLDPKKFHYTVKTEGGGAKSQLDAITLGISRALVKMDPTLKPLLKKQGLLTRDSRMVERKKPGLRKARRAEQFSKR